MRPASSCTSCESRQWRGCRQIVLHREILAEIREQENRKPDARLFGGEARVLEISLALLQLNLGFEDIGMRGFPALLQLFGDAEEFLRFAESLLGVGNLAAGHGHGVIGLRHRGVKASCRHVRLGAGYGLGTARTR